MKRFSFICVFLIFVLTSCSGGVAGVEKIKNYQDEFRYEREESLSIENINGNITVNSQMNAEYCSINAVIKVRAYTDEDAQKFLDMIEIKFQKISNELRAESVIPRGWTMKGRSKRPKSWSVDLTINIPDGLDIDCKSTNGSIEINGPNATVNVQNTNGDITVKDSTEDVTIMTVNGSTTVANNQDFKSRIRQTTQNGSHTLDMPGARYGRYILRTSNGEIDFNMPSCVEPELDLNTVNGSIIMNMGERFNGVIELKTTNGEVETDMVVNTSTTIGGTKTRTLISGRIGAGGGRINATTTNGNVSLELTGKSDDEDTDNVPEDSEEIKETEEANIDI